MKLPIAGGGNPKVPSRSATHLEIEFAKLARLGMDVEEIAEDGAPLDVGALIDLAADNGKLVSHYYAAAALASDVELSSQRPVQLVFCAGKCQSWGALDAIDAAADVWEKRGGGFAIGVRSCLDKCEDAAVCQIRTPSGTATLVRVKPEDVTQALSEALT
jgi:hypothetical protein